MREMLCEISRLLFFLCLEVLAEVTCRAQQVRQYGETGECEQRLEASLKGQMKSKLRLEASLEGQVESKLRLEASLEGQVEPKWRLEATLEGQVELGVRLGSVEWRLEGGLEAPSCAWSTA